MVGRSCADSEAERAHEGLWVWSTGARTDGRTDSQPSAPAGSRLKQHKMTPVQAIESRFIFVIQVPAGCLFVCLFIYLVGGASVCFGGKHPILPSI